MPLFFFHQKVKLRFGAFLLMAVILLPGSALRAGDEGLEETLLKILKPRYPEALFKITSKGRVACRLESTVYRKPDRLGPGPGGIAVEFEKASFRWYDRKTFLPQAPTRDLGDFLVHERRFSSADGEFFLRAWIKVPLIDPPPPEFVEAIFEAFRAYVSVWKPEPQGGLYQLPPGPYNYPGGDHLHSLDDGENRKEVYCTLEEIADCGQVFLHPRGDLCLLIWHSPDEGIGNADVVLYCKESRGWRAKRVKNLLLPAVSWRKGFAEVRPQEGKSSAKMRIRWPLPWTKENTKGNDIPPLQQ